MTSYTDFNFRKLGINNYKKKKKQNKKTLASAVYIRSIFFLLLYGNNSCEYSLVSSQQDNSNESCNMQPYLWVKM